MACVSRGELGVNMLKRHSFLRKDETFGVKDGP
jgi:hypothetical protein